LEPPLPLLSHRLDQEGSLEATRTQETVPEPYLREDFLTPEENFVSDLEAKGFMLANPLITDLSTLLLIQILPCEVTSPE